MKCNYTPETNGSSNMSRDDRRAMHKRLMPTIKRIVELEKQIQANHNVDETTAEIGTIMESLSLVEMMAVEDYICSHELLSFENK